MRVRSLAPWLVVVAAGAAGCGPALTEAGAQVQVADEPPAECKRVGKVQGSSAGGHDVDKNRELARMELRNAAGEMGGNAVVVEDEKEGRNKLIKLSGVAYQCPADG